MAYSVLNLGCLPCRGKLLSRINIQACAAIDEWFRQPVRELIFYRTRRFNWCGFVCQINRAIAIAGRDGVALRRKYAATRAIPNEDKWSPATEGDA